MGAFFLFFIFLRFVNRKAEPYGVALFTPLYTTKQHNIMLVNRIKTMEQNIETKQEYKTAIEIYLGWKIMDIQKRLRGNPEMMVMMMCKPVMDFEMDVLPKVDSDPIAYADGVQIFMEHMKTVLNNSYRPDIGESNLEKVETQFLLNYIYHDMD